MPLSVTIYVQARSSEFCRCGLDDNEDLQAVFIGDGGLPVVCNVRRLHHDDAPINFHRPSKLSNVSLPSFEDSPQIVSEALSTAVWKENYSPPTLINGANAKRNMFISIIGIF